MLSSDIARIGTAERTHAVRNVLPSEMVRYPTGTANADHDQQLAPLQRLQIRERQEYGKGRDEKEQVPVVREWARVPPVCWRAVALDVAAVDGGERVGQGPVVEGEAASLHTVSLAGFAKLTRTTHLPVKNGTVPL